MAGTEVKLFILFYFAEYLYPNKDQRSFSIRDDESRFERIWRQKDAQETRTRFPKIPIIVFVRTIG